MRPQKKYPVHQARSSSQSQRWTPSEPPPLLRERWKPSSRKRRKRTRMSEPTFEELMEAAEHSEQPPEPEDGQDDGQPTEPDEPIQTVDEDWDDEVDDPVNEESTTLPKDL